ncbi:MAG: ATP-binding protein [Deltaproteobacteria bacterium]|jgi:hypothetical protein|nr:ATP-binding protein [Deltaproteobacteria bacterium]
MNAFSPSSCVSDPQKLFGWNNKGGLLERATEMILSGVSFQIKAERRAGKTSMVNCLMAKCNENRHKSLHAPLPVNIPFYERKPKGTEEGYRFALYKIIKSLHKAKQDGENWIDFLLTLGHRNINLHDPLAQLTEMNQAYLMELLDELKTFLTYKKQSMLLFFDEYEYMEEVFNDNPKNFFSAFRGCQQDYEPTKGGIFCVLAGAENRSDFASRIGSSHFNAFTGTPIYLTPLQFDDFRKMWDDCLVQSSDDIRKNVLNRAKNIKKIYEMCGGIPSYGKILGQHFGFNEESDFPSQLQEWFKEIFNRQTEKGKLILLTVAEDSPLSSIKSNVEDEEKLLRSNLISFNESDIGGYHIHGGLWKRYLDKLNARQNKSYEISHAGDLARLIIREKKLPKLLELVKGNENDWLEFKATLIRSGAYKEDSKEGDTNDDYIWHVLKAIIAMANTRGGCVIIGVSDEGHVIGIDKDNYIKNQESDYLRKYIIQHLGRSNLVIDERRRPYTPVTALCKIEKPNVSAHVVPIGDEYVVALVVSPNEDSQWQTIEYELEERKLNRKEPPQQKAYFLCRSSNTAENIKLYDDVQISDHRNKRLSWFKDGLEEIWLKLI